MRILTSFAASNAGEKIEGRRTISSYAVDYGAKKNISMIAYEAKNDITVLFDLK